MKWIFCIAALYLSPRLTAQYTFFTPANAFAVEVSAENTGSLRLPAYRNAITSLLFTDKFIVGGTSSDRDLSPYIFSVSANQRKMVAAADIGEVVSGQKAVMSGFCRKNGKLFYAGTIPAASGGGGHLLEVEVGAEGNVTVKDIGVPVENEGILTMIINRNKTKLYGITYPTGRFFSYDIATRKTEVNDDIIPSKKDLILYNEYSLTPYQYLCRALVEDDKGLIYGSAPVNKLFYFDPSKQKCTIFSDIPEVWGRRALGQVEAWAKSPDGKIYGGNAGDGQLFMLDPATKKITNLGKPVMMNRLRALTFGGDGKLYGLAGAQPGYVHLFTYDKMNGFRDLGNPQFIMKAPGIEQGIDWRGFQLATIAASPDGKFIAMGEDESLSQLMVFPVGK